MAEAAEDPDDVEARAVKRPDVEDEAEAEANDESEAADGPVDGLEPDEEEPLATVEEEPLGREELL